MAAAPPAWSAGASPRSAARAPTFPRSTEVDDWRMVPVASAGVDEPADQVLVRPPAVGRTSGSTQGPVAATPVPDRLEASVRGPAPSSAADIAEALSNEGWLTVLDDPLLAREHWVRVAGANGRGTVGPLRDGGRSSYGCYLRVDDPGPCAGPWADIARLEMSSGIGCDAAVEAAARAAGCRASRPLCTGTRGAPVNLTPIAGLERHLHRLQGDVRLALRAGARGGARTQPRGTDGMIDDEGTGSRSSM